MRGPPAVVATTVAWSKRVDTNSCAPMTAAARPVTAKWF
jgi:hypothetical protein